MNRIVLGAGRLDRLPARLVEFYRRGAWTLLCEPRQDVGYNRSRASPVPSRPFGVSSGLDCWSWWYASGDRLPFGDGSIGFILSEHFLEHLAPDEAAALLGECARVLCRGGIIRTAVPDAVLRPEPERPGAQGHRSRWTVYGLSEALRVAGLVPSPLRYYDYDGARTDHDTEAVYAGSEIADRPMAMDVSYLLRPDSLVVDGRKTG